MIEWFLMEKFLVVANWKANVTRAEADVWCRGWAQHTEFLKENNSRIQAVVAPPHTLLHYFNGSYWDLELASQDVSAYVVGAYTGEVPAKLLVDMGVKYCLVGHSERRKYLHETNVEVEAKISQALQNGIIPIICAQNLEEVPENIRNFSGEKYMIMYEPFSAISTEGQYHPEGVEKVVDTLTDWRAKLNLSCRFLYGGSVNPDFIQELVSSNQQLVSGLVVGHASLEVESFFVIIKKCLQNPL